MSIVSSVVSFHDKLQEYVTQCEARKGFFSFLNKQSSDDKHNTDTQRVVQLIIENSGSITRAEMPLLRRVISELVHLQYPIWVTKIEDIFAHRFSNMRNELFFEKLDAVDYHGAWRLLEKILQEKNPAVQYRFWSSLNYEQIEKMIALFAACPREVKDVKRLVLTGVFFESDSHEEFMRLLAQIISSCSRDLEELRFLSNSVVAELSNEQQQAIIGCPKLHTVDLSQFILVDAVNTLMRLSANQTISAFHVQLPFGPELDGLSESICSRFKSVKLHFEVLWPYHTVVEGERITQFASKCKNAFHFVVNTSELVGRLPEKVESLQLLLPESRWRDDVIEPLEKQGACLSNLTALSLARIEHSPVNLDATINLIKKCSNLRSLAVDCLSHRGMRREGDLFSHLVRKKIPVTQLACPVVLCKDNLQHIAALSQRLAYLRISLLNCPSQLGNDFVQPVNTGSSIRRLTIVSRAAAGEQPLLRCLPTLRATNPEELCFLQLEDAQGQLIEPDVSIESSAGKNWIQLRYKSEILPLPLEQYTRLKRIIFLSSNVDRWCGEAEKLFYPSFDIDPFDGGELFGNAIDC